MLKDAVDPTRRHGSFRLDIERGGPGRDDRRAALRDRARGGHTWPPRLRQGDRRGLLARRRAPYRWPRPPDSGTRRAKAAVIIDASTGAKLFDSRGPATVYAAAFSPDGKRLVVGGAGNTAAFPAEQGNLWPWTLATPSARLLRLSARSSTRVRVHSRTGLRLQSTASASSSELATRRWRSWTWTRRRARSSSRLRTRAGCSPWPSRVGKRLAVGARVK